ncbi:M61 family metallopeptidase [Arundinibacter roseus]|uniref:M61 family peptidase n=1 Tax=Arundinibacter roseus TaxID=2070510 RepID=A0A4R4KK92_9BACT|nr:PDZ domain-containing protein [Arundinibacter roseus]TDB67342.1 M61 family peptidase [Arundinibacter roseus]
MNYLFLFCIALTSVCAQTYHDYQISFPQAVHHEAQIAATFTGLEDKTLELRMSRTSPGRYAIHEFAKNVYNLKATDENGKSLTVTRPNPYQWDISGHHGTVRVSYTLFANRGDGTYSQIDETHAHLNIPATFLYAPKYPQRPVRVKFDVRQDLKWKVATQLKDLGNNVFMAPDLDYFMDSPTEISNFSLREFTETSNGKSYSIRFALHHGGTEAELDTYIAQVRRIVQQEKSVYGELPDFDFGQYTFLACYLGHVSGDGMEHRNSTVLTSTRSLKDGGMKGNASTVSHEFFHCWNVERIRPKSLQPFDYTEANMSGELWFAEGFTQYYTSLILRRAGIITSQEYVEGLSGSLNYVWNSPARAFFTPIEMSYQAPFVDAATSLDPVNRENTFISYYTYGSVLGLALDLSLRNLDNGLSLDGFMQAVWQTYGKHEQPYTVRDLQLALETYAGKEFGQSFFSTYIFASNMPDYKRLLAGVGVDFAQKDASRAALGVSLQVQNEAATLVSHPTQGSAAYAAGLTKGDRIVSLGYKPIAPGTTAEKLLAEFKVGETVEVGYERFGKKQTTSLTFQADPSYRTSLQVSPSAAAQKKQKEWLEEK